MKLGNGVALAMFEAIRSGIIFPNRNHNELEHIQFSNSDTRNGHPTEVARRLCGSRSACSQTKLVYCYSTANYAYLRPTDGVSTYSISAVANAGIISATYTRDQTIKDNGLACFGGTGNRSTSNAGALQGMTANNIIVGNQAGDHAYGDVAFRGIASPHVLGNQHETSYSTPSVASIDALLADNFPHLHATQRIACILAGSTKGNIWKPFQSDHPTGMDSEAGCGVANICNAYAIAEAYPQSRRVRHLGGSLTAVMYWHRDGNDDRYSVSLKLGDHYVETDDITPIRHLFIADLPPGNYELEVQGGGVQYSLAWISG